MQRPAKPFTPVRFRLQPPYIMKKNKLNYFILSLILVFAFKLISSSEYDFKDIGVIFFSPIVCSFLILSLFKFVNSFLQQKNKKYFRFSYAVTLFFLITLSSFFGVTKSLTGSFSLSPNLYLFGLSFYSAYLAYTIFTKKELLEDTLIAANPLLIITGPIAYFFKPNQHRLLAKRITYYLPFLIIGIFFIKVLSIPLTYYLWMIELQDILSAFIFALIFEVFIYFNFAGLSIIVFAISGILGFRIPLNFKQPFSSRNLIEYWRGWHVSLSVILKTMFYKPLRKYGLAVSLFAVYLSSGLWHGASANFIFWGLFHAICFYTAIKLLNYRYHKISILFMFLSIVFGRMIFADDDILRLLSKFNLDIFSFDLQLFLDSPKLSLIALFIGFIIIFSEFFFKNNRYFRNRNYKFLRTAPAQIFIMILIVFLITGGFGIDYAVYGQR